MDVEAGSLYILVLNHKVFRRQQTGKMGLDFVIDGHRFVSDAIIIQKKRVLKPSAGQFKKWHINLQK
jgi:hypothetical protein